MYCSVAKFISASYIIIFLPPPISQGICFIIIVVSSIALNLIRNENPRTILVLIDEKIQEILKKSYNSVVSEALAGAGLGLGVALSVLIAEVLLLVLRFINFGLINHKIHIFLIIVSLCFIVFRYYCAHRWMHR